MALCQFDLSSSSPWGVTCLKSLLEVCSIWGGGGFTATGSLLSDHLSQERYETLHNHYQQGQAAKARVWITSQASSSVDLQPGRRYLSSLVSPCFGTQKVPALPPGLSPIRRKEPLLAQSPETG